MKLNTLIFCEEAERIIHAKKLGKVPEWNPALAESNYSIGKTTFSAKDGLGSVPLNQDVYYFGFVAMIKPSLFKKLAAADTQDRTEDIKNLTKFREEGYAFGIPHLFLNERQGKLTVTGHEGRGRLTVVQSDIGDIPIPVHIFPYNKKQHDLTPEYFTSLNAGIVNEDKDATFKDVFTDVYVNGKAV